MARNLLALGTIIVFEIIILFLGCQSGQQNPFTPGDEGTNNSPLPESASVQNNPDDGRYPALWGYHQISYDSANHEIRTVPLRGPAYAFNVVKFLQPPSGKANNIHVQILDDSAFAYAGLLNVRVLLSHPFPGQPVYNGFDVCGIFITEGSHVSNYNSALSAADQNNDPTLLNPDGYTRWMNPTEFLSGDIFGYKPGVWGSTYSESSENSGFLAGATLNPYKYFALGLGPDKNLREWLAESGSLLNRGMFPAGATCSRDYNLHFPIIGSKIVFTYNYAVLANWAEPLKNPPTNPVVDFPRIANAGWPLHIFTTDKSIAYYTETESGGVISLDLEIFDWDALSNPEGVPGEVGKIVIWSDTQLVAGGWAEAMDSEVDWNSGFIASTSVASIEFPADPVASGTFPVWIEVQSTHPPSYDQGFGKIVPFGPLAGYATAMVEVGNCPKAGAGQIMYSQTPGSGDLLNDVEIIGENFVQGPELGIWLELKEAGGGTGDTNPFQIHATDVKFVNSTTLTADLNFAGAPFGDYGLGCMNGCGNVTTPAENEQIFGLEMIKVVLPEPTNITLFTNRTGQSASPLTNINISWDQVVNANFYRVHTKVYDINGNLLSPTPQVLTIDKAQYNLNLNVMINDVSGIIELWATSLPDVNPQGMTFESNPSNHAFVYLQNFETSIGQWQVRSEDQANWRFIRSNVACAYSGLWGLKTFNKPLAYDQWILLSSPEIPEMSGMSTAYLEFVHRFRNIKENDGFQAGWLNNLPPNGASSVAGYYSLPSVNSGFAYNDNDSPALRTEFGLTTSNDNNWQLETNSWQGWYLSKFNISEILTDDNSNYIAIGAASQKHDLLEICIDDLVILIY